MGGFRPSVCGPRGTRGQWYQHEKELKERDERALSLWEDKLQRLIANKGSASEIAIAKNHIRDLKKDVEKSSV